MLKRSLLALAILSQPVLADDLPEPISCYQESANAKDVDAYMSCFAHDAEMIDVSRTFRGHDAIRAWALREVISNGDSFRHRRILEQDERYAKTEVNWLSWDVHYSHWRDEKGKITRMSLQYADGGMFIEQAPSDGVAGGGFAGRTLGDMFGRAAANSGPRRSPDCAARPSFVNSCPT